MRQKVKKERIEWIDICRALAIIFVFLGHWDTPHLHDFAYSFHLKLFFILSGFFAIDCVKKNSFKEYFIKKGKGLLIPMILWGIISFIWNHFDSAVHLQDFFYAISDIRHIQPNYWFFPALFMISITYYLLKKYIQNDKIIFILSYLLLVCFGKHGLFPVTFPSNIVFNYLYIESTLNYLFWYCFGTVSFSSICSFIQHRNDSKKNIKIFHLIGTFSFFVSVFLFFKNISQIFNLSIILEYHPFVQTNYLIVTSLINIITMIYFSTFLTNSSILTEIGNHTMAHMGLEYITHNVFAITLFEMFHLSKPIMTSTYYAILVTFIQFLIHTPIIQRITIYLPILEGKKK